MSNLASAKKAICRHSKLLLPNSIDFVTVPVPDSSRGEWAKLSLIMIVPLLLFLTLAQPAWALSPPIISPPNGTYSTQQTVTMSASATTIYYTTDGSDPTTSSTRLTYSSSTPPIITNPTQINAVAYQSPTYSSITTAYLDVDARLAPLVIGSGAPITPTLRLRSDFGLITGLGSPAPVTQWTDLSINAANATGTSGSQPTAISRASGSPVVSFNGTSQYLSVAPGNGYFNSNYSGATMFVVTKPTSLTSGSRIFDFGKGSNSDSNITFQITSSPYYASYWTYNGTSGTSVTSSPNQLNPGGQSTYQLLECIQNHDSPFAGTFYLNGIAGTSGNMNAPVGGVGRNTNFLGQSSGGGNYYSGNIAEVLIYYGQPSINDQLTDSQRVAVETLLLQKYQIFSQIPVAPTISVPTGTLLQPTQVVISCQPGAITYITTDGTDPNNTSTVYSGTPIQINYSQTLKAIAIKNGISSPITTRTYTLDSNQWPVLSGSDMNAPSINLQLPTASQ